MSETAAKIIKDSISPWGVRLTTFEIVFHRFELPSFNTYRAFSRNSASSRAIPVEKQLERMSTFPAWPIEWAREQAGMQGGSELEGSDLLDAMDLFREVHGFTVASIERYLADHPDKATRAHKSLINRLMEPFLWQTVVVTSTEWDNFFNQRASERSPLAQPEIRAVADLMLDAYRASTPVEVDQGGWHMPYIEEQDWDATQGICVNHVEALEVLKKVSVARCARVSYLTHDGKRDISLDVDLFEKLIGAKPMHASPLEHVATPAPPWTEDMALGNFYAWHQLRHDIQTIHPDALGGPADV